MGSNDSNDAFSRLSCYACDIDTSHYNLIQTDTVNYSFDTSRFENGYACIVLIKVDQG